MRTLCVDASAFITLASVGEAALLGEMDGEAVVPEAVAREVVDDPAARRLDEGVAAGWLTVTSLGELTDPERADDLLERAGTHLGREVADPPSGDLALLAAGLAGRDDDVVVVTDDKPLRRACRSLGVPLSGSLGVVIAAVKYGALGPDRARDVVVAMDAVGARYSATLLDRAERLIDEAAGEE